MSVMTEVLTVRLPAVEADAFRRLAADQGQPISPVMRTALRAHLHSKRP